MTAARTGRKQPSIRTLWAIAKSPELHLTDEDLHAVVYRETGKESMKMLTQGEVNTVARVLQNMKDSVSRSVRDKRTDTGGDIRTTAQRRKIYALCEALGWNDDPRRIQGFVKRVDLGHLCFPSLRYTRLDPGRSLRVIHMTNGGII